MGKRSRRRQTVPTPAPASAARIVARSDAGPATPLGAPAAAVAVSAAALVVYLVTLHRGVPGGDSGELIAAAVTGGVAHPSGYPLFLLMARAAALVPVGSVATRVNALSAVADAVAAGFLTVAAARLSRSTAAGLLAGGLFAFSSRIWSYATVAEVFALNNLVIAALVATIAAAVPNASRRHVAIASALLGLGIADHVTSIFVSVPIVVWLLLSAWRAGATASSLVLTASACGLAGLMPYAYLPFASAGHAAVSWGEETSLAGFVRHVSRAEYGTFQLASTPVGAATSGLDHALAYVRDVLPQTLWVGAPLALVGAARGVRARSSRGAFLSLLVGLAAYVVVFNALSNLSLGTPLLFEVQARFWQMPNLIVFVCAALGFAAVSAALPAPPRGLPAAVATVAVIVQAGLNFASMDESRNRWIDVYGRSILAAVPQGGLILSRGDLATNAIRYLRYVEHVRPDLGIIDEEILSLPWGPPHYMRQLPDVRFPAAVYDPRAPDAFSMQQFLDANIGRFPIIVCGGFKEGDASVTPAAYRVVPRGICAEVVRAGTPFVVDEWLDRTRPLLPDVAAIASDHPRRGTWEELVLTDFWNAWHARASFVMTCEDCGLGSDERLLRFVPMAEDITRLGPNPPASVHKNLAYALTQLFPRHPEMRDRLVAALQQYVRIAPQGDPDLPTVRENLAKLGAPAPN